MEGDHLKNYTQGELRRAIAKKGKVPCYTTSEKSELARMPGIDSVAGKGKQKTGQTPPNTHPKKPRVPKMPPHPKKPPVPKVKRTSGSKRKKQHKLMQSTTNWFDLPLDLKKNILYRVGVVERLWTVQKVCIDWHEMCKDPSMWRVIKIDNALVVCCWPYKVPSGLPISRFATRGAWEMCRNAVDRSRGQLVDITMAGICDDELLEYVADRSSQLRSLRIAYPSLEDGSLSKALKKLPFLEELSICLGAGYVHLDIEALGKYCPMLRSLELIDMKFDISDKEGIAIGENLPELRHLKINKNFMLSNTGLQAILDGCHCLQVLDLRLCSDIDLKGDVGKRLEHIECVLHTEPYCHPYAPNDMDLETYRKEVVRISTT